MEASLISRTAALSTIFLTVKRLIALSFATQREQLEQRKNLTWPRPFLLRPPFLLFLVYARKQFISTSTSKMQMPHPSQQPPKLPTFHRRLALPTYKGGYTHHFVLSGRMAMCWTATHWVVALRRSYLPTLGATPGTNRPSCRSGRERTNAPSQPQIKSPVPAISSTFSEPGALYLRRSLASLVPETP